MHLGNPWCKIQNFISFLGEVSAEEIVLVGDIIDHLYMGKKLTLTPEHQEAYDLLFSKNIVGYLPGNHDSIYKKDDFYIYGSKKIPIFKSGFNVISNKKIWLTHGDDIDLLVIMNKKRILNTRPQLIKILLLINKFFIYIRDNISNKPYYVPIYIYFKIKKLFKVNVSKEISSLAESFETTSFALAKNRGVKIIVSGHIHTPKVSSDGDITYCNCGDWVVNCTYLKMDSAGFSIIDYQPPSSV